MRNPEKPLPSVLDRPLLSTFARSIESDVATSRARNGKTAQGKAASVNHGALYRVSEDEERPSVVNGAHVVRLDDVALRDRS